MPILEDHVEQELLGWFAELGYEIAFGPNIGPDGSSPERSSYKQVILTDRLMSALARINPHLPESAIADATRQLLAPNLPGLVPTNRQFHRWLTTGIPIQYQDKGETRGDRVKLADFNLAVELLERLLKGEMKSRFSTNVAKDKKFSELLQNALTRYRNRAIETAQVIEELIAMARQFMEEAAKGEKLGLNLEELAFYDALASNESAVRELGDDVLKTIALELTDKLRKNLTVDWSVREAVRAKLRLMVRSILIRYKYPPDKQEAATETVLKQAETLTEVWLQAGGLE